MKLFRLITLLSLFTFGSANASLITSLASEDQPLTITGSFGVNEFALFEFSVLQAGTFIDFKTLGSTNPDNSFADTEIGLYEGFGTSATLLANNDDFGGFARGVFAAGLSFGLGSGEVLNANENGSSPLRGDGRDGVNLVEGDYTIILAEFNTTFTQTISGLFASNARLGNEAVNFELSIFTDSELGLVEASSPSLAALFLLSIMGLFGARKLGVS